MVLDFLFPNRCIECNRIISPEELVCQKCEYKICFSSYDFYSESDFTKRCRLLFPVEGTFALMEFQKESLSRKIIHELKYKNREIVGKILANWTYEKLQFLDEKPDLLVNIPLHPKKLKKRGYNQLHAFTEEFSKKTEIPYDHDFLIRIQNKTAQAKKGKSERIQTGNIFCAKQNTSYKHILIIDDVFTTGNTIASAAWEILNHNDTQVSILILAIDE